MTETIFRITENIPLTSSVYRMTLSGDTSDIKKPGQFVNVHVDSFFLRRPISVCDYQENTLTLIYKVVGNGTDVMSKFPTGKELNVLTGLGNGYDTSMSGEFPVLVGGGVGVPPLYRLAKDLIAEGKHVTVIMGFRTSDEIFYADEFVTLGAEVILCTEDGSRGRKGFVTKGMENLNYTYVYACGPEPMLKALDAVCRTNGQFSFEERMGCGFGVCMGCSKQTKKGPIRICHEGPVIEREDILW